MNLYTPPRTPAPVTSAGVRPVAPASDAALDALADALAAERRLIDELAVVMERQRTAVGADDLAGIDDSVFATHRLLLTLGEARTRRRTLNQLAGCSAETGVKQLDDVLGPRMTARLREAREALQAAARRLSREIEVNRGVLRQAMAGNEAFVRALRGAPEQPAAYAGNGAKPAATPSSAIFTRTA